MVEAPSPPPLPSPSIVGRHAELAAIRRAIGALGTRAAQTGRRAQALLVEGPAGIGKTSLWLAAIEEAEAAGMRVLRARPAEAEATFAYAALADLLRDDLPHLVPRLPRPQRAWLEVALGVGDRSTDGPADPQAVQSAAANALLALAAEGPLLVAIDDAPWLDAPTAAVVEFFARRAVSRPVIFVVTQRVEEEAPAPFGLDAALPGGYVERLWLEPLSVGALHRLLAERLEMTLPRPYLIRLHELSGGVPFHALEIARALHGRPLPPIGAPWPIPVSLRDLLLARARALPDAARELLLMVSAGGTLSLSAAERLLPADEARDAVVQAVDEGLLATDGDDLRAAHPLIASAVYGVAGARQRREAHSRLSQVVDEPEARARHRALATTGPDESVAAELEAAGRRAAARGAPEAAAELLRLARERTPADRPEARDQRAMAHGEALMRAADMPAAQQVLGKLVRELPTGPTAARARIALSEIEWYTGTAQSAVAHLLAGLEAAAGMPDQQGEIHYRLAVFYDYDLRRAIDHGRQAVDLLEALDRPSVLASALMQLFWAEIASGRPPRTELLDRGLAIEPADTPDSNTIPGIWYLATDRVADARHRFTTMLEHERQRGDLSSEADLLTKLAEVELIADDYSAARELADAATAAARQHGDANADPARRVRALIDAYEGRLDEALSVAQPAAARAVERDDPIIAVAWLVVAGVVAAARADHAAVEQAAIESARHLARIGVVEAHRLDLQYERPEALVGLGRTEEARVVLAGLDERQALIPRAWLAAAIARGRAELLAARGDFGGAVAATDVIVAGEAPAGLRRFDRARTLVVRGSILRRARARRDAAAALDEATAIFATIGAAAWAERARAESARLGRHRPGGEELTPAEEQVCRLAASGLTNREVAERLSVSPKTVEAHLARAYAKLGIRSRAELGRLMGER